MAHYGAAHASQLSCLHKNERTGPDGCAAFDQGPGTVHVHNAGTCGTGLAAIILP